MKKTSDNMAYLQGWKIVADMPAPAELGWFESLMTLGNGLLGVRGASEEPGPSAGTSWPMTLMAGVYDRPGAAPTLPAGERASTRLAPLPNPLEIVFDDGAGPLSGDECEWQADKRTLDMKRGLLRREACIRGRSGRVTRLVSRRLVSQARPNIVAIRYELTPENYSGRISLTSRLDGRAAYPDGVQQTRETMKGICGDTIWLETRTRQSRIRLATVACHRLHSDRRPVKVAFEDVCRERQAGVTMRFDAKRGRTIVLEKIVAIHASLRESDPMFAARAEAGAAPSFAVLAREHAAVWAAYWRDADVEIQGDRVAQTMARFWVFQLLQAASHNNVALGLSASVPAKALSGWGYGGRVFWDTEMYMLPFYARQFPDMARTLLMYRHDRLAAARKNAVRSGCDGIKFPWESADSGREECPKWCSDGKGGLERWHGGKQQIHVNADVAYGAWRYWLATGDRAFLAGPGLDILIGTACYWASRVQKHKAGRRTRYEIRRVIGPDEGHQSVNNNLYTNAMARWNLLAAAEATETASAKRSGVAAGERTRWRRIAAGLQINFDSATGLYEAFDGYFSHPDPSVKQADTLLALHLFPELRTPEIFRRNFENYAPLTKHGSSLSPCMHALFALELKDARQALAYARLAFEVDGLFRSENVKGLHAAAMGGGWSMIVDGFGGVRVTPEGLDVRPRLPPRWRRLAFSIRYRTLRLRFRIEPDRLVVRAEANGDAIAIRVFGKRLVLKPGRTKEWKGKGLCMGQPEMSNGAIKYWKQHGLGGST